MAVGGAGRIGAIGSLPKIDHLRLFACQIFIVSWYIDDQCVNRSCL